MSSRAAPGNHGLATGARGEQLAAEHLERLGFAILARNVRYPGAEIDLIACDGQRLVFAEVKSTRSPSRGAGPFERLGAAKRRRLRRAAVRWLAETPGRPPAREIRFDAIAVELDADGRLVRLEHLEAAF